ncbi:MAG: hypothetical protein U9P10_03965 [Thermodesulfobacteriota bacterium]|nr:hypothetical protein [Thermodesulfobacteriota bacterium]
MLKYALSFAAGCVTAKVVTKSTLNHFKNAALKSYVVIKDKFSNKNNLEKIT